MLEESCHSSLYKHNHEFICAFIIFIWIVCSCWLHKNQNRYFKLACWTFCTKYNVCFGLTKHSLCFGPTKLNVWFGQHHISFVYQGATISFKLLLTLKYCYWDHSLLMKDSIFIVVSEFDAYTVFKLLVKVKMNTSRGDMN